MNETQSTLGSLQFFLLLSEMSRGLPRLESSEISKMSDQLCNNIEQKYFVSPLLDGFRNPEAMVKDKCFCCLLDLRELLMLQ